MEQKSFVFIKDFRTQYGVIKKNSELRIFRGFMYLNGGMMPPSYEDIFVNLINDSSLRDEYLVEKNIINNKI